MGERPAVRLPPLAEGPPSDGGGMLAAVQFDLGEETRTAHDGASGPWSARTPRHRRQSDDTPRGGARGHTPSSPTSSGRPSVPQAPDSPRMAKIGGPAQARISVMKAVPAQPPPIAHLRQRGGGSRPSTAGPVPPTPPHAKPSKRTARLGASLTVDTSRSLHDNEGDDDEDGVPVSPASPRSPSQAHSQLDSRGRAAHRRAVMGLAGMENCFRDCSDAFRVEVAHHVTTDVLTEGTVILTQADVVTSVSAVVSGSLEVLVEGTHVEELHPGSLFGEQCLLDGGLHATYSVRAQSTVILRSLKREKFVECLENHPAEQEVFRAARKKYREVIGRTSFSLPLFQQCESRFVSFVDLMMIRRTHFPGDVLIQEGSAGTSCLILNAGVVNLVIGGRPSGSMGDGSIFGELTLLGLAPLRTATVIAEQVCHISILHQSTLRMALDKFPRESVRFAELVQERHADVLKPMSCLRNVEFFKPSPESFLDILSQKLEERLFMPGQEIVKEGCTSHALYIIGQGTAACYLQNKHIATLGQGDLFGEMSIFGSSDRATATVRVTDTCFVHMLRRAVLLSALEHFPEELQRFLTIVKSRRAGLEEKAIVGAAADLAGNEFFAGCSVGFLSALAANLEVRLFLPGEDIIKEGDLGDAMFIVLQGEAYAMKDGAVVAGFKPGSLFGEFTALGINRRRETTVRASTVCVVSQLRRHVLWEALEAFPKETEIFEAIVLRKLEMTLMAGLQACSFFNKVDHVFLTFLAMRSQRKVALPDQWIIKERTTGDFNLAVLNRGSAALFHGDLEFCHLEAGDDFGATVALGIHRTYPFSLRAKSMCHIVLMGRGALLEGVQRYPQVRRWLEAQRVTEEREHRELLKLLRERAQKVNLQKQLWQNVGKLFPHIHCMCHGVSGAEGESKLRMFFNMWTNVYRRAQKQRAVSKVMDRATGSGSRRRGRMLVIKCPERPPTSDQQPQAAGTPDPARPRGSIVADLRPRCSVPTPMNLDQAKLLAQAPLLEKLAPSPPFPGPAKQPAPPGTDRGTDAVDRWHRRLSSMMACRTPKALYGGAARAYSARRT